MASIKYIYINNKDVKLSERLLVNPDLKQSNESGLSVDDAVKMVCGSLGLS